MSHPEIGDRVELVVSGLVGIVVSRSQHLRGCDRIGVQPEGLTKDSKPHDTYWFDEGDATILGKKVVDADARRSSEKVGGPALPGQVPSRENPK